MGEELLEQLRQSTERDTAKALSAYTELVEEVAAEKDVDPDDVLRILEAADKDVATLEGDVARLAERREKIGQYARMAGIQRERQATKDAIAREVSSFARLRRAFQDRCAALERRQAELDGEETALRAVRRWLLDHPSASVAAHRETIAAKRECYANEERWLREQLDPADRGLAGDHARLVGQVKRYAKRKHLYNVADWEIESDRLQAIADNFDRLKLEPLRKKLAACRAVYAAIDAAVELVEAACCEPDAEPQLLKAIAEIERQETAYAAVVLDLSWGIPGAKQAPTRAATPQGADIEALVEMQR